MDKILAPIKQRILKVADLKEDTRKVFFNKMKLSASNFRSKSLYSEVSGEVLAKITSIYPDVNSEWLLTGKGCPLKTTLPQKITPRETEIQQYQDKICLLETIIRDKEKIIELQEQQIKDIKKDKTKLHTMPLAEKSPPQKTDSSVTPQKEVSQMAQQGCK